MIKRTRRYILDNSFLLIAGAVAGLAWANLSPESYSAFKSFHVGKLDLQYLINDLLMAFFFALAGKEIWEALLPGGALSNWRRSSMPILCAVGGMAGPSLIYLALSSISGEWHALRNGWAVPCATDIAFSYMIARWVFGKKHGAVSFLLLLAVADDALGLGIIALFYPVGEMHLQWLLLSVAGVVLGIALRRAGLKSFWFYIAGPGALSWIGFAMSGIHPALGLLPIIPTLPHARAGDDLQWERTGRPDALDRFESFWFEPVEVILGLFGLINAGVQISAAGSATWIVMVSLLVGKPIGICATGIIAGRWFGLLFPDGTRMREMVVIGCAAGIGFTVALFVATVAFPEGPYQDAAKMGALASSAAVAVTYIAAKLLRVGKQQPGQAR